MMRLLRLALLSAAMPLAFLAGGGLMTGSAVLPLLAPALILAGFAALI